MPMLRGQGSVTNAGKATPPWQHRDIESEATGPSAFPNRSLWDRLASGHGIWPSSWLASVFM